MSIRRVRWLGVLLPMMLWAGVLVMRAILTPIAPLWLEWGVELLLVATGCVIFANWVADNFERHQREMDERAGQLEALRQAGIALTTETEIELLLQRIVDESRALANARYAALGVLAEDGTEIEQFVFSGMGADEKARIGVHPKAHGILGTIMTERTPVRIDSIATDPRSEGFPTDQFPMTTLVGVALVARGQFFGNLYLTDKMNSEGGAPLPFTDTDVRTLEMFASHASVAIENARLQQQNQQIAIMQERERFGMNMHDGIIQSIYALGLILEDTVHSVGEEPALVRERLQQVTRGLSQVIRDIRAYILNLRPQRFEGDSLQQGLETMVKNITLNWGIKVSLSVDESAARSETLSAHQASELLHIVQEALTNVHKHSGAGNAMIEVGVQDEHLEIAISDDGRGFDVFSAARRGQGNGLRNMQQRARALHGEMEVESTLLAGTTLRLSLPLEEGANSGK